MAHKVSAAHSAVMAVPGRRVGAGAGKKSLFCFLPVKSARLVSGLLIGEKSFMRVGELNGDLERRGHEHRRRLLFVLEDVNWLFTGMSFDTWNENVMILDP